MTSQEKIARADIANLKVIQWPDPRLAETSTPVEHIDASLQPLIDKMFELMFRHKGVGLAGSQVGITVRLFVASPSYEKTDRRVYINPRIIAADGSKEDEEGCLSLPGVNTKVKRRAVVTIEATGLDGKVFQESGKDLMARIYQHEIDHLDGMLIRDKMGSVSRMAHRRAFEELQEKFAGSAKK